MSAGMYLARKGFLHGVNPSVKIACTLVLFLPPFFFGDPVYVSGYLAALCAVALASASGKNIWRAKPLVLILVLVSLVMWPLFRREGEVLFQLGPLAYSLGGLRFGLNVALRLVCFLVGALILLGSTKVEEFTAGLVGLGAPYAMAFTLSLAFRLVPLFLETGTTIVAAQRSRGLNLDSGGPLTRARKYVPVIVPIVMSSLRRADGLSVALESRGFGARVHRTSFIEYRISVREWSVIAGTVLLIGVCAAIRLLGFGR